MPAQSGAPAADAVLRRFLSAKHEQPERTVILSSGAPVAEYKDLATTGAQFRITVTGCGPIPARLNKKRPLLEYCAFGKNRRLGGHGVTCNGKAVLPKRTDRVRIELLVLGAQIKVTVEPRPPGERKKYAPKRWISRRDLRPVAGRYRRPKATI